MRDEYKRIIITGLPGSGKTTMAKMLLIDYNENDDNFQINREYAFVHGDEILPCNIVKVCRVLDKFVAEHFCIADLMAKELIPPVDLAILLDITEEVCGERIKNRNNHQVHVPFTLQELQEKLTESLTILSDKGIPIIRIDENDEDCISQHKLIGAQLFNFLLGRGCCKINN